MHKLKH